MTRGSVGDRGRVVATTCTEDTRFAIVKTATGRRVLAKGEREGELSIGDVVVVRPLDHELYELLGAAG